MQNREKPTTSLESESKFNIFVPVDFKIEKSVSSNGHGNYVRGFATTPDIDLQGDIVLPENLNIKKFLTDGYINYEHKQGNKYRIGVPTDKTYIDPEYGLFVEAKLFMDNPYAQEMWSLAHGLSDVQDETRVLGFSIEGNALRAVEDDRVLENITIENVALTTHPANPNATWETLVKSFTTGTSIEPDREGGAALRHQSLGESIRSITSQIKELESTKELDWGMVAKAMQDEDRWEKDCAKMFLRISEGTSRDEADEIVEKFYGEDEGEDEAESVD